MFKARTSKTVRTGKSGTGRASGVKSGVPAAALAGPVLMVLCVSALPALAGPRGERVVRGEASFHRQGRNTTITAGNNAIIEYDSFNIRRRQTVEFIQPNAGARVMNRITGADPTTIRGTLRSNGIVYIVNPAGVIFGPTATIDVGGIYAAGGGLSNQDFLAGNNHFTNVTGRVVNQGSIRADSAVGLIGRRVANFGTVVAPTGTVTMVAGDEVWIGERGGNVYARFSTDSEAAAARGGVENHGTIVGNQVLAGVGDYYALAVFDSSFIQARTVALRAGTGTTTTVAGTIDVSNRGEGGVGGSVTVTGERVALRDANIDASGDAGGGSVRIGGDFQGGRGGGADGQAALNNAERTYVSSGTTINADAVTTGTGGTVIVWSDVFTNYNGSITARGGSQGGDGGFAEVSGKEVLAFNGTADLSATDGDAGRLLLDPRDITIANGGAAVVASNNEFGENSSTDVSFDADLITAITNTGTAVTLQANRDITINEAITSNNAGGDGGDITLQAGRSITIGANITTDNGDFSATANETVANGVVDAQRSAGAAVIDMDNNVVINAGSGNVTLTLSTGAGLTNSTSGNVIVEDITTTGTVTITNNGPTAGSSIVIDGAGGNNSLLTAGNLALIVGGAGAGGGIGTNADPIAFAATNLEASGQSAGVFLDTTSTVNVGGASGSITGISTSGGGAIELTTGAGNLNTSEAITGTGTVQLTGTAIGLGASVTGNDDVTLTGPVTITGSRTVSAGSGQLEFVNTVTLSGAGATVTLAGTPSGGTPAITFQDTVSADAGGSTLVLEQGAAGTAFNIATGTDDLLEATDGIDQLQDGFDSIVFGRSDGTVNIGVGAATFIDPVTIRTTSGNININGALTGTDDASFTLTPGAASNVRFGFTGTAISTAGGNITINGDARVGESFTATLDSGGGIITITGDVDGTAAGVGESIVFDAGAGDLDIGGSLGTGQALGLDDATITDAAAVTIGGVDIEGTFSTTNALTGAFNATGSVTADAVDLNGTTFDFDAAVEVLTGALEIGSTAATTLNFDSTVTADAGGIDLTGTGMTFDQLITATGGGDVALDGAAVTLTGGITTTGGGTVGLTNSGLLSINGAINASGAITQTDNGGTVTVAADVTGVGATFNSAVTISGSREISATTGALSFTDTVGFSTAAGTGTFTGGTIAFAANVTPNGGGTTVVFQSPDATTNFGVANGLGNQLISAASIAFLQDGFTQIVFGRSDGQHNIDVGASTFQDPVLFRSPTSGNITVSGLITGTDNASVTLDTGAGPARILLDVTGNAIVTAGEDIVFGGLVRVAEGEAPVIDSAGGLIQFGGAVDGTTGGAAETLTLDAGTGNIDFQTVASAVSGASGASDATGLTTLTITDATDLDLQSILISGAFTTTNALGGALQAVGTVNAGTINLDADSFDFDAAVTAGAGGIDLTGGNGINFDSTLTAGAGGVTMLGNVMTFDGLVSTSGGGDVDLNGSAITLTGGITTAGANANVQITNAGVLDIDGAISANGTFTQVDNGGSVSLGANVSTAGADGTIQFNSDVTATADVTLDSGAGAIDLNGQFDAGANDATFETNDFQPFAANSIIGTGAGQITLRPENASDTIGLGNSGGQTANYSLADFAAIADGAFAVINVGHSGGTHDIVMSGFSGADALRDEWVIDASGVGGTITLVDDIETDSNDLTFDGAFLAGGNIEINSGATGVTTFTGDADFAANDVALTGDNTPDFQGGLDGSGILTVRPFLDTTAIDIGNVVAAGGVAQGGMTILNGFLLALNAVDFSGVEFGWATTGEHSIQIGDTAAAGAFNHDLTFHAPAGAGVITVLANLGVVTSGNANATGALTFDGDVVAGNTIAIATDGLLTFEQNLDMNGNDVTLTSADLEFNGGAGSVSNSGAAALLTLGPASASDDIDVGNLGVNARVGAWTLDQTDLDALDASVGDIGLGTPVTGTHSIFVGEITSLNFNLTLHAPGVGGEARLFDDITTGGNDLTFNADVRIANTETPTITTGGGDLAFNFDVFGSTTGAGETLTIDAGAGSVTVAGFIAGQSTGVSNSTGLTDVTITAGDVDLGVVAGDAVDITGTLSIDHTGELSVDDDISADTGVSLLNTTASGTSVVTLGANVEIAAATSGGLITIGTDSTIDTAGFDLTLTGNAIDILGSIEGGDGTNTLTIRPDAVGTAIELGTGTSLAAGALILSNTELSRIADGFGGIEFGFAGTGQHAFEIGGAGFNDAATFHAPGAGGSFEIVAGRSLVGAGDASFTFLGSHSTLTLNNGSQIVTAGQDINIDDDIVLADGAGNSNLNVDIPLISTGAGGGNITIDGSIRGTDNGSGDVERLRLRAGTGSIVIGDVLTVNGTVANVFGAAGGGASAEGLVDLRIVSADDVTLEGVNIGGTLRTESTLTGAFTANEEVLVRALDLAGTTFDFIDGFGATNNGGGNAAFTNSGLVTTTEGEATGDITATGSVEADSLDAGGFIDVDANLTAVTLQAGADIDVGGDLNLGDEAQADGSVTVNGTTTLGDRIVAGGDITLTGDVVFAANPGASDRGLVAIGTITTGAGLNTTDQDVTIRANEVDFNGGANSVTGGGVLTIRTLNAGGDMRFGFGSDAGASTLDLTDTDLAAIDSAFDTVVFGVSGGSHDMVVSSATFRNATVFNYQAGTMLIDGPVFTTGAGSTLDFLGGDAGGTTLSGNITSNGGAGVSIDDNVTLGSDSTITINSGTGIAEIDGTVDGAFALNIIGGDGSVEIDGVIGGTTALASLNLSGDQVTLFNGIGTVGAAGVTGDTLITGVSNLTLGGTTYNTNAATYRAGAAADILGLGSATTATFTSNGSDITFDGGGTFTIDDGVGLTVNSGGGTINLGAGFDGLADAILFNGPVVLTANTSVNNQGAGATATVTFADTVDGSFNLDVTTAGGSIFFQGDIGATEALDDLTVDSAGDVELENIGAGADPGVADDAVITADGSIIYNGTLYSTGSSVFTAGTEHSFVGGATAVRVRRGDLTFAGGNITLVDGGDLTVTTEGGNATFTAIRGDSDENLSFELLGGTGTFAGIGTGNEIGDIFISCGNIALNGNVFGNTFTLRGGSVGRNIEIAGDGSLGSAVRISRQEFARLRNGFTSITIGRADGEGSIVVGGDGGGALAFNDPLTLLADGAPITSIQILEDMVGAGDASLTIDTGIALLSADITTAGGDVTLDGATLLGEDVTITTDGGNVAFTDAGTINTQSAGGPFGLTVDAGAGDISIDGAVGTENLDDLGLAFLDLTGGSIDVAEVVTQGRQSYDGATTLNGNITSVNGPIAFDGAVTLATDVTVQAGVDQSAAGANVTFGSTIAGGGNSLTVIADGTVNAATAAGTAAFRGAATGLDTIEVTAGTIEAVGITTVGAQTYNATDSLRLGGNLISNETGDIAITGDLVITANSRIVLGGDNDRQGDLIVDGTITDDDGTGPFSLELDGAQGAITVTGDIGGSTGDDDGLRLSTLTIGGSSALTLEGVRVSGALNSDTRSATINGPIDSDGGLTISVNERLRLNGTVDVAENVAISGLRIDIGDDASDAVTVGGIMLVGPPAPGPEDTTDVVVLAPIQVNGSDIPSGAPGGSDTAALTFNVESLFLRNSLEVTDGDIRVSISRRFVMDTADSALILNGGNFDQIGVGTSILGFDDDTLSIVGNGSRITFAGPIRLDGDVSFQGERLEFNGGIDDDNNPATRSLTLRSGGQTIISDDIGGVNPIGSLTTRGAGRTILSADIATAGPVDIGQRLTLGGNSTIDTSAGGNDGTILIDAAVDDDGNSATSSVFRLQTDLSNFGPDAPTITLRAPIGAESAITSLVLNATGASRASLGQQTVVINPGTPDEVTLTVNAPLVPTVIIDPASVDDITDATTLGPTGATGMVIRTTGDFVLGAGEKMVVSFGYEGRDTGTFTLDNQGRRLLDGVPINQDDFGGNNAPSLAIITTGAGNIQISDVTVDGNLILDAAGSIAFTQRTTPSLVLGRPDPLEPVADYYQRLLENEIDNGSDLFVNGFMYFNDDPANTIIMGTPFAADQPRDNLGGSVPLAPENFGVRGLLLTAGEAEAYLGIPSGSRFPLFLDQRAEGNSGQQSDIQQIAPPEAQSGTVEEATSIGTSAKDLLADAGINTRYPEDFLDALLGRALYDDLSSGGDGGSYATVNRFNRDIAVALANEYAAFFRPRVLDENGQPVIDPETGEEMVQDRRPEIKSRLNDAVREYRRQTGGFDPAGFRQFVRTNADYAQVESDLVALQSILEKFRVLGLSPREYLRAREVTLSYVRPDRVQLAQFIEVVEGAAPDASTPVPIPLPEEAPAGDQPVDEPAAEEAAPAGT